MTVGKLVSPSLKLIVESSTSTYDLTPWVMSFQDTEWGACKAEQLYVHWQHGRKRGVLHAADQNKPAIGQTDWW